MKNCTETKKCPIFWVHIKFVEFCQNLFEKIIENLLHFFENGV